MRIVTWNCRGGLHDKHKLLTGLAPDVAIVQECAEPDILRKKSPDFAFHDCEWSGEYKNKGLGVFSFGKTSLRRHQSWDRRFHLFVPTEVRGTHHLNLLAVWAFNGRSKKVVPNPGDTSQALEHYRPFLSAQPSVVAGDFNASVIWDDNGGYRRFRDVDTSLGTLGLTSGYHATRGCNLGEEPEQTHFHVSRNAFHIDYIYLPKEWCSRAETAVDLTGAFRSRSDHAPVVLDLS